MMGFSLHMILKLKSSSGMRLGACGGVLEPGNPRVWQKEPVFVKPIINQG